MQFTITHTHLKNWLWKRDKSAQTFFLHNTHESIMCTHWTAPCFEVGMHKCTIAHASSFIRTNCEFPVEIVFRYVESPKCVVDNLFPQIDFFPFVPYRFWVRGETEQTKHNVCVAWKISSNWIGKFCSHLWYYQMFYYKLLYIMLYCFSIH